ncbi:MAG: hypothetical protein HUJ26_12580 [Planctomycetaceae bacterium]|nr:hypothetical protein [Planctomycetaceae bacterium]
MSIALKFRDEKVHHQLQTRAVDETQTFHTRRLDAVKQQEVGDEVKPCGEFDLEMLRVFSNCIMSFIRSPLHQDHLAQGIAQILSVDVDDINRAGEIFFELACAKIVMECSVLSQSESQVQISDEVFVSVNDEDYRTALKETCFRQFIMKYSWLKNRSAETQESKEMKMSYLRLYDDAYETFSKAGLGKLLARRIFAHLEQQDRKVSSKETDRLIEFLDQFFVQNYWAKLWQQTGEKSREIFQLQSIG